MADVRTALRTLQIFEIFGEAGEALALSEIATRLSIPVSSCFQIVHTLVAHGYLYGVGKRQNYYPTRRLLDVMQRAARHDPLIERVQPTLDSIRDATGETVGLGTLQADRVVYLASAESRQMLRVTIANGSLRPVHSTATGKALLDSMDADARRRLLGRLDFEIFTPKTIGTAAALTTDLEQARVRGYYVTFGEGTGGLSGLSVPIVIDGETYAIAVSGPSERIEPREAEIAKILIEAAGRAQSLM